MVPLRTSLETQSHCPTDRGHLRGQQRTPRGGTCDRWRNDGTLVAARSIPRYTLWINEVQAQRVVGAVPAGRSSATSRQLCASVSMHSVSARPGATDTADFRLHPLRSRAARMSQGTAAPLILSSIERMLLVVFACGSAIAGIGNVVLYLSSLSPNYEFHVSCTSGDYIVSIVQKDGVARDPFVEVESLHNGTYTFAVSYDSSSKMPYTAKISKEKTYHLATVRVLPLAYKYSTIIESAMPRPAKILKCE